MTLLMIFGTLTLATSISTFSTGFAFIAFTLVALPFSLPLSTSVTFVTFGLPFEPIEPVALHRQHHIWVALAVGLPRGFPSSCWCLGLFRRFRRGHRGLHRRLHWRVINFPPLLAILGLMGLTHFNGKMSGSKTLKNLGKCPICKPNDKTRKKVCTKIKP